MLQLFVNLGILMAYIIGLPYDKHPRAAFAVGSHSLSWWRIMFLSAVIPAVLQVGMCHGHALPEQSC